MFIGRKKELEYLEDRYKSNKAEMIVLYGRRRVGKTELLKEFSKDKKDSYMYICKECTDREQLHLLSNEIIERSTLKKVVDTFDSWEKLFEYLGNISDDKRTLLIIDEFPYMIKENPSIASRLQALWDLKLKDTKLMIILSGSAMSFIEDSVLGHENPLYGRTTGVYKLEKLTFKESIQFYQNFSKEDLVKVYSIVGGIPFYLNLMEDSKSIKENILAKILSKGQVLYNESEFLIRQELRDVSKYYQVIEAIALGNTKLNDIYNKTMIDKNKLSSYISNLIKLNIVEREHSVISKVKTRINQSKGLYRIKDNYFKFYFRYVYPYISQIEREDQELLYEAVLENDLNEYVSFVFEDICREYMILKNRKKELDIRFLDIGRYFNKDVEIDILARIKNDFIFAECKWRNAKAGVEVLNNLKEKSKSINESIDNDYYYIFSKSGFKQSLIEAAKKESNVRLFDLDAMFCEFES